MLIQNNNYLQQMNSKDERIMLFHSATYRMYDEVERGIEVSIEGDVIRFYFENAGFNPEKGETARGEFHKWVEMLKAKGITCYYELSSDKYIFQKEARVEVGFPVAMNEFDPILKLIRYYKHNPAIDKLSIEMIVPPSLKLDIDKVKAFFDDDATIHYSRTGGTSFSGTVKNETLKIMIMRFIYTKHNRSDNDNRFSLIEY
jgi:hypothetical protein